MALFYMHESLNLGCNPHSVLLCRLMCFSTPANTFLGAVMKNQRKLHLCADLRLMEMPSSVSCTHSGVCEERSINI